MTETNREEETVSTSIDDFGYKVFSVSVALMVAGVFAWLLFLYLQWERLAFASSVIAWLAAGGIALSVLGNRAQKNPSGN